MSKNKILVWRVLDGIEGHEKQSKALAIALTRISNTKILDIRTIDLWRLLTKNLFTNKKLIKPDLIIGVGHKTHLIIFLSRLIFGGNSVLIMKPSLPINWFDLCFIPYHDVISKIEKKNVVQIYGALNNLKNLGRHNPKKALILIGGKSKYFNWNNNSIVSQIKKICTTYPNVKYYLTTSRRTPPSFVKDLMFMNIKNLKIILWPTIDKNWIKKKLNQCQKVWVTKDSISMIYEGISSGGEVSIINLVEIKKNKISTEVDRLISKEMVVTELGKKTKKPKIILSESDRCAIIIKDKFFCL